MYPTDRGGRDSDETLDWLWDLEGYDVGAAGAGAPVEDLAAAALPGVKKHLRKQPVPADDSAADEFATAAFALDPPTGPIGVPPALAEFSPATIASPIVSPMEDEYVRRSRRPLMAAAVLLIVGLGIGVGLAVSGGGSNKQQIAQQAKVAVSPTTATTPDTTVAGQPATVPAPTDTTTVPAAVTGAASTTPTNTPPGTTVPARRPGSTTPPGTTPRTAPPTAPPTSPSPTTPATTTPPVVTTATTTPPVVTTVTTTPPVVTTVTTLSGPPST